MKKPVKVLHIDDSLLDIELVKDALEREKNDFIVESVRSRADFERCIKENIYDVILSDFNILGFDGLQVLDAVHAKNPDIPVIIVTGTGSEEVAVEAMKRGAADYVIKHQAIFNGFHTLFTEFLKNVSLTKSKRKARNVTGLQLRLPMMVLPL